MNAMGSHMDPQLVDKIVHEVKSQGVFDEFRKDSMSDVDTKPAYQNLRQRVENTVKKFLSEQRWSPEMNKNQLRERLRKHITESGFLDVGVERIVDQVVNPKIGSVFQPRIEEIAYKYLGLPPPIIKCEPPAPIMPPLPPLPLNGTPLKIETNSSLLPTGLEQVSPDSDKATLKSEYKDEDQSATDMEIDEKMGEDDDESPPFEPLIKCVEPLIKKEKDDKNELAEETSNANDDVPSGKIEQNILGKMANDESVNMETQDTSASEIDREASVSFEVDVIVSQESQLSQVSSDSHISEVTATASHSFMENSNAAQTTQTLNDQIDVLQKAPVNISEEAQMPKFNENSSDTNVGEKSVALHFDIKKDEIKFEGTERKSSIMEQDHHLVALEGENSSGKPAVVDDNNKKENETCPFGSVDTNADVTSAATSTPPTATPTPTPHDSSFGSSLEDASNQLYMDKTQNESMAVVVDTIAATVNAVQQPEQPDKKENGHAIGHSSSSSSSRHKKHSKDKRRSHESKDKYRERDKDKDRNREKERDKEKEKDKDRSSKDKNKDGEKDRDKERGRDRDKDRDKSRDKHSKSRYSNSMSSASIAERSSSSSKRSSSSGTRAHDSSSNKAEKTVSSGSSSRSESHDTKREKRDDDKKHQHSGSNSRKAERKSDIATDDHATARDKLQRRKSTDSNDEDKNADGTGYFGRSNNTNNSSTTTCSNGNDTQKQQHNDKSSTSNTEKTKGKSEKTEHDDLEQKEANPVTEVRNIDAPGSSNENDGHMLSQSHRNKVVILNDMLQNPNIHIDLALGATMKTHTNSMLQTQSSRTTTSTEPTTVKQCNSDKIHDSDILIPKDNIGENELCFFEEINGQFSERLRLLDNAMYRCRRVVNNLRFDCATTDTSELFESDATQAAKNDSLLQQADNRNVLPTRATLTIDCIPAYTGHSELTSSEYCDNYGMHRKRSKRSVDEHRLREKPSPTPSDTSVNSKENVSIDKNAVGPSEERRLIMLNKLRQQRYSSEDLYKPRPVLSQRSKRRGVDSVI